MKPAAKKKKSPIATMPFGRVYPLYVQKAEKKGRTQAEVDQVIRWLTGSPLRSIDVMPSC